MEGTSEQNRREIALTFVDLFNEVGLTLKMDDLAARLHISKKTIYRHFESKEAILDYVFRAMISDNKAVCDALIESDAFSLLDKIRRVCLIKTEFEKRFDGNALCKLLLENEGCHKAYYKKIKGQSNALRVLLREGQKAGVVNNRIDPYTVSSAFLSYSLGLLDAIALDDGEKDYLNEEAFLNELLFGSIRVKAAFED